MNDYPWVSRITLKQSDLGPGGEVSVVAIAALLEDARYQIRSSIDHPQARDREVRFVLARIAVELVSPARYPGTVEVGIGIGRIGRTSFDYVSALIQDERCVARSDATVAVRDRRRITGSALPSSFREALSTLRYRGEVAPA